MDKAEDLDEAPSNGLFSMSATGNAEVVTPDSQRGGDGLWSVSAKQPADGQRDLAEDQPGLDEDSGAEGPAGDGDGFADRSGDSVVDDGYPVDGSQPDQYEHEHATSQSDDSDQSGFAPADDDIEEVEGEIVDMGNDGSDFTDFDSTGDDDIWDVSDASDDHGGDTGRSDNSTSDSVGSVFTAEPVDRGDDVVDEPDVIDDDGFPGHDGTSSSLFSSGGTLGGAAATSFAATGAPYFTPAGGPGGVGGLWEPTEDASQARARSGEPLRSEPLWEASDSSYSAQGTADTHLSHRDQGELLGEEESPGYEAAILKLHPQDRERASVALSVTGALLEEGEEVLGVVTGQMLGRPAAVVVTAGRVLVVNDRRWQPVVDIYKIDTDLRVRGRHDRNIAALSFSNDWSLSMVDGITEVSLAMDLADQIRIIADS